MELKIAPDSTETLKNFEKVVNDPSPIFDAKVRKAALEQLDIWVPKSDNPNRPKLIQFVRDELDKFTVCNRVFVFLVDVCMLEES